MPNATGVVKQFYPNDGKPRLQLDTGLSASAFNATQMAGVEVGKTVSFAYDTKVVNGKEYNNVKGNVAIVGGSSAQTTTPQASGRRGEQVGASINQAIAAFPVLGLEPSLDNIEHLAQSFLLMGDRLAKYQG